MKQNLKVSYCKNTVLYNVGGVFEPGELALYLYVSMYVPLGVRMQ